MTLTHTLDVDTARHLSANSHRHWRLRQQAARQVREDVRGLANGTAPVATPCAIDVTLTQRTNGRRDPDNVAGTAKPVLDGLVDAGVLPDDGHRHVASVTYRVAVDPEVAAGTVRLDVTVEPCEVDA